MRELDNDEYSGPSNIELEEHVREFLLHGAAGQAVVAVVLRAGLQSVKVTDAESEVLMDSLAGAVEIMGRPRAATALIEMGRLTTAGTESHEPAEAGWLEEMALQLVRNGAKAGLANPIAMNIYAERVRWPTPNDEVPEQVSELMDLVDCSPDERAKLITQWRTDTDSLLRDYWLDVERVAESLRSSIELDAVEVKELVWPVDDDLDHRDESGEEADLSAIEEVAVVGFVDKVVTLQREEQRASQRFHELLNVEGGPDVDTLAEVAFELTEARRRQQYMDEAMIELPPDVRNEVTRRVAKHCQSVIGS